MSVSKRSMHKPSSQETVLTTQHKDQPLSHPPPQH